MKNSHIEWTDHTFNPWEGCTKVSPGCVHCYAETRNSRFGGGIAPNWGHGAPRRRTSADNWKQPLKWDREAAMRSAPIVHFPRPRVFCASLADWLDDEVPVEWLSDLLYLVAKCSHLDWLLLTKRPQNWMSRMRAVAAIGDVGAQVAKAWLNGHSLPNLWIGTTVEDQQRADERIPALLAIPARVRFLSCEPLLSKVRMWLAKGIREIDWVICGGESGHGARPMHPDWARSLRDQCAAAGVAFFFKQWGEWAPRMSSLDWMGDKTRCHVFPPIETGEQVYRVGKLTSGRLLDSVEHNAFPEVSA